MRPTNESVFKYMGASKISFEGWARTDDELRQMLKELSESNLDDYIIQNRTYNSVVHIRLFLKSAYS